MDHTRYHKKELPRAGTLLKHSLPTMNFVVYLVNSGLIPRFLFELSLIYTTQHSSFFTNSSHYPNHTNHSALWVSPSTCKWAKITQRCLAWMCQKDYSRPFHNLSFHRSANTSLCLEAAMPLSLLFFSPTWWEGKWWLMHFTFHLAVLLAWEEEARQAGAMSPPALQGATATTATACPATTKSNILSH